MKKILVTTPRSINCLGRNLITVLQNLDEKHKTLQMEMEEENIRIVIGLSKTQ